MENKDGGQSFSGGKIIIMNMTIDDIIKCWFMSYWWQWGAGLSLSDNMVNWNEVNKNSTIVHIMSAWCVYNAVFPVA